MSYKIAIPEQVKADIKEVVARNQQRIVWMFPDLHYLVEVYYRYVQKLYSDQDFDKEVRDAKNCANCRAKIVHYFKQKISNNEL